MNPMLIGMFFPFITNCQSTDSRTPKWWTIDGVCRRALKCPSMVSSLSSDILCLCVLLFLSLSTNRCQKLKEKVPRHKSGFFLSLFPDLFANRSRERRMPAVELSWSERAFSFHSSVDCNQRMKRKLSLNQEKKIVYVRVISVCLLALERALRRPLAQQNTDARNTHVLTRFSFFFHLFSWAWPDHWKGERRPLASSSDGRSLSFQLAGLKKRWRKIWGLSFSFSFMKEFLLSSVE